MNDPGARCFPLLPLQQAMVLTLSGNPHAGVDIQQCFARVREPLNLPRLARAWQAVMNRHEGLRTHFLMRGIECFQQIGDDATVDGTLIDWRDLSPSERDTAFEAFLREDRKRGFDLWKGPVWRVTTFDCAEEGFRFVLSHPHAIVDAQSAFNIMRDLFAFHADPAAVLPRAGTFRDYMTWYAGRDTAAAKSCWRDVFKGFDSPARLLLPKPADTTPGLATFEHGIDPALGERIRQVADREKLPLSAVVKAAWSILLGRLSGSNDVVFGEVRSGRRKDVPDMQTMVGMFVATVPVRAEMKPGQTFRELVHQLRELQNTIRDHEHTAIADVQKWCGLDTGTPLFESALVYDHMSFAAVMKRDGGEWMNREIGYREHTAVPITLNVTALPEILIKISWERSRFAPALMQRLPGYLERLLEAFTEDPDRAVAAMDMLGREERARLLVDWNATAKPFDESGTLPRAFERIARRHPERVAVRCGGASLTYRELDLAIHRLAVEMRGLGVSRGSRVGLCIDRSIGMLVAMLAALKTGAGYVPLDPSFPDDRLQFMVSDAKPTLVLAGARHADRFVSTGANVLRVAEQPSWVEQGGQAMAASSMDDAASSPEATDVAYVIYTSGSTGRPKGVMISHRNVLNCFAGMDDVLEFESIPHGMWLAVTSISFDISVIELLWTLTRGYGITICRDSGDPMEIVKLLESGDITHLQCTPALTRMLANVPGAVELLRRLRTLMLGGEALTQDLLAILGRPIVNVYGPTETAIWSTAARLQRDDVHIGRPIANTRLYVLDASGAPVPTGVAGELYIGGRGVALGYLHRPELDAERFLPDPFASGESGARMYRTGDLVRYREDGTLEYLERLDNQVKVRGHRVELGEIEAAMRALPKVANAVVVPRQDRTGEKRLVAYFTLADGAPGLDDGELRAALRQSLPDYEIPSLFVMMASLPLTPNLKIDRKALPDPESSACHAVARQVIEARNDVERQIARLWQEVLGVGPVSITDNFFSLGGDSLRAVQVMLGIRASLGVEIASNALHQYPTLEALAQSITDLSTAARDAWATWETLGERATTPPIIGVHAVDRIFVEFAKHLGLRVDTITSRVGFDGKLPPYHPARSVEDMAERYLEAIRERYPHGPYVLLGFCLGGLIATEIARRLVAEGEQVSFLGLFNSPPPPVIEDFRGKLARHRNALRPLGVADTFSYVAKHSMGFAATAFRSLLRRVRPVLIRQVPEKIDAGDAAGEAMRRVTDFGMRMVYEYRYRPYGGHIHLFHGAHWPRDYINRWSAVAQEGVDSFLLPGGHLEMMEEPNVPIVATRARDALTLFELRRSAAA